ncbi:hypothetical protein TIFTF001_025396 [Ficus carica]|uniref:Uncharacterized protein n=1 Tax=Ficus carica TaxID=3494 RepID=A0AA88AMU7_FICCA|nr:hypothetical protein TIFTF001_025396 [Ficus carica]
MAKGSRTPVVQSQNSGLKLKRRLWGFVDQSKPTEHTGRRCPPCRRLTLSLILPVTPPPPSPLPHLTVAPNAAIPSPSFLSSPSTPLSPFYLFVAAAFAAFIATLSSHQGRDYFASKKGKVTSTLLNF